MTCHRRQHFYNEARRNMRRFPIVAATGLLVAVAAVAILAACSNIPFDSPDSSASSSEMPWSREPPPAPSRTLDGPLQRFRHKYGALDGIEGTGQGLTPSGEDAITVYVSTNGPASRLPKNFEGHPVLIRSVPGGFHATPAPEGW